MSTGHAHPGTLNSIFEIPKGSMEMITELSVPDEDRRLSASAWGLARMPAAVVAREENIVDGQNFPSCRAYHVKSTVLLPYFPEFSYRILTIILQCPAVNTYPHFTNEEQETPNKGPVTSYGYRTKMKRVSIWTKAPVLGNCPQLASGHCPQEGAISRETVFLLLFSNFKMFLS